MSIWGQMSQEDGQRLANQLSAYRPMVGTTVKISQGKHKGKIGRVIWHGRDQFSTVGHYGDSNQQAAMDCMGTFGFRIRVQTETEQFFCSAEYAIVAVDREIN